MKIATILTLVCVMLFAPVLQAGGCYRSCGYSYSYYPQFVERIVIKEVVAPVAVPVLVPASVFQYVPALTQVAPVQPAVPVSPVNAPVAAPAQAAASTAELDRLIRERIEAILREKANQGDDGPPILLGVGPVEQPRGNGTLPAMSPEELQAKALTLLSRNCYECHTQGVKTAGTVTIFTKSGEQLGFQPSVPKSKLLSVIESGDMPRKGTISTGHRIVGDDLVVLKQYLSRP